MYGRTARCDDIALAGHRPLFYVVTFVKMLLFERGHKKWQLWDGNRALHVHRTMCFILDTIHAKHPYTLTHLQ